MTAFSLAAAQSISIAGDVPANIERHLAFMRAAAGYGVQVLVIARRENGCWTGQEVDL